MGESKLKKVAVAFRFEGRKDEGFDEIIYEDEEENIGSEEEPIAVATFLSKIGAADLAAITEVLRPFYKNMESCEYNPASQFLAQVLMKIKKLKFFTQLDRLLNADNGKVAKMLGFEIEDGKPKTPNRKTLWHFVKVRIGEKMNEIFAVVLKMLKSAAENSGIEFGDMIGHDSTPIRSNDKEAEYNGHYEKRMYKGQLCACLKTLVPLYGQASEGASSYDGHFLLPFTEKISILPQNRICADCHYATLENYACANHVYGIETYFGIAENISYSEEGSEERINEIWQKNWEHPLFNENATMKQKLDLLMAIGKTDVVGYYYRNKYVNEKKETPEVFNAKYHRRSLEETMNSKMKEMTAAETICNGSGKRNMNIHWKWCILAVQLVALIRMRHGVKEELTSVKGISFG